MILIDYSQLVISNILGIAKSDFSNFYEDDTKLFKHIVFNSIRGYKNKYKNDYGQVVICLDSKTNWRKDIFPNYKIKRKKKREESKINWDKLFVVADEIIADLKEHFPYIVIGVDKCEADDVISVLSKRVKENNLIISSDKDFKQLLTHKHIRQICPKTDTYVTLDVPPIEALFEHIIRGDASDSVPNVLSDDDVFKDGRRQKSIYAAYIADIRTRIIDNSLTEQEKKNWARNLQLIDLQAIPAEIIQSIIAAYNAYEIKGDRMTVLNYLINNDYKMLIDVVSEF